MKQSGPIIVGNLLVLVFIVLIAFDGFSNKAIAENEMVILSASKLTLTPKQIILKPAYTSTLTSTLRILIPFYSYPNWYDPPNYLWDDVAAANSQVSIAVVINPSNGPGGCPPNSDYQHGLSDLRNAGITILGYIFTSYGMRGLSIVKAEVDLYDQCFNIDGIFFDEVATDIIKLSYYKELYDYVKLKPNLDKVILNPGTHIHEEYISLPASDTTVIFEGPTSDWQNYVPSPYVNNYPAERFAALVHTVPNTETMRSDINLAVTRNIGQVYMTDDIMDDPYDYLPTFWQAEIDHIQSLNGDATPSKFCLYLPLILKNN